MDGGVLAMFGSTETHKAKCYVFYFFPNYITHGTCLDLTYYEHVLNAP